MPDIDIGGQTYHSNVTVAQADIENAVNVQRSATWAALSNDQKAINVVAATRRLDVLNWQGWRTGGSTQEGAWPRDGLTYEDGTAIPDDAYPVQLQRATAYLAANLASDPSSGESGRGSETAAVKRVKAGSAEVEFASGAVPAPTDAPIQDLTVHDLIAQWLVGPGGVAGDGLGAEAFGTDERSQIDEFQRDRGFA